MPGNHAETAGLYKQPVAVLDFASLYPSIYRAHNLCYTTLVHPADLAAFPRDQLTVTPTGDAFVKPGIRQGLLPFILAALISARAMTKQRLKHASRCVCLCLRVGGPPSSLPLRKCEPGAWPGRRGLRALSVWRRASVRHPHPLTKRSRDAPFPPAVLRSGRCWTGGSGRSRSPRMRCMASQVGQCRVWCWAQGVSGKSGRTPARGAPRRFQRTGVRVQGAITRLVSAGAQTSPLQCIPLADSCLAYGAQACRTAISAVERARHEGSLDPLGRGARVVYGHTDSLCVHGLRGGG